MAKPTIDSLTTADRIDLAKAKMQPIIDNALHLIDLYETNQIVAFSDTLSKQIPFSHAANAFNVFQDAMFKFEILRLCVLWDPCQPWDLEKESIPAVIQLVDNPQVVTALREKTREAHQRREPGFLNPSDDPEILAVQIQVMNEAHEEFASRQGVKAERRLRSAIQWSKHHMQLPRVTAMRNYRDKHLAHSLSLTNIEKKAVKAGIVIDKMRYSDPRWLYPRTLAIINNLYLSISGTGFHWRSAIDIARRDASTLWSGCTFTISQRRGLSRTGDN